jgi:hypothetical protein
MKKLALGLTTLFFVVSGLLFFYGSLHAEQGWSTITAKALKKKMDDGDDYCLINVLPKIVFNAGHIKNSVNIPIGKLETSSEWPQDKNKPLIFYCMGVA